MGRVSTIYHAGIIMVIQNEQKWEIGNKIINEKHFAYIVIVSYVANSYSH